MVQDLYRSGYGTGTISEGVWNRNYIGGGLEQGRVWRGFGIGLLSYGCMYLRDFFLVYVTLDGSLVSECLVFVV